LNRTTQSDGNSNYTRIQAAQHAAKAI
jgi:hypothetical protein